MPEPQYTFGPPGQAGATTVTPEKKKQAYTFGPKGGGAITPTPPPAVAAPAVNKMFTVGEQTKIPGMVTPGNLDLSNRPIIKNEDGSISSEFSTSFGDEKGREILVPTIVNGKFLTPDGKKPKPGSPEEKAMFRAAQKHYEDTGENLGVFDNPKNADAYAEIVHNRGQNKAAPAPVAKPPVVKQGGGIPAPPGPFSSGVASGMGFDPAKLEAVTKFKLGDKMYPVAHPMVQQGAEIVKQAAQGMGSWMEATAKDPAHIMDPLDAMARVVEFHTGTKWDPFGLTKAGIEETALDEIGKGIKTGNTSTLEHGAGRLVGGLSNIFAGVEAPEVAGKLKALPGEALESVKIANEARNKSVVTAAANNVLQHDAKNVIIPTIVQAVKNTWDSVGRRADNIDKADITDSAARGATYSTPTTDVAQLFADAKKASQGQKVPTPETTAILKNVLPKQGAGMTWGDLKRFRTVVGNAARGATGIDSSVLWKVYDGLEKKMRARAAQLGKLDAYNEYIDTTRELKGHEDGILAKLQGADTGLKLYEQLAKESNRPELNDMFNLLERHGGIPSGFTDDLVKTRRPIFELAKRADGGDASGGRLGALLRHPMAAGTAMVGTGLGLSLGSPVPITGSFVASLIAAQKAANFMDRYDAVKAMRSIRRAQPPNLLKGLPTPFPGGAGSPSIPPPPGGATPSPVGPGASPTPPTSVPSGPVSPSVGAPAAPASLENLMTRIKESMKPTWAKEDEATLARGEKAIAKAKQEKADMLLGKGPMFEEGRGAELVDPTTFEKGFKEPSQKELSSEAKETQKVLEKTKTGREPAAAKSVKQTPYEEFGVKIDRERLTTPEAVRAAKADAKAQIEELGRARYVEAAKLPVGEARTAALEKLKKDVAAASRSVDKMQTPGVSRKQRDVLRKAVDAGKVKPAERSVLESLSPEQVEQKASAGVTDDEANMMEMIDLGREAEAAGPVVKGVYEQIYKKTGGDPRTSLPMLRALMEQVRAAKIKKPAAD